MAKNKHRKFNNKGFSGTGASHTRKALKGMTDVSGSPNEDILYNLQDLRERSRMLSMAGGLALSALKTNRTNVIGMGLILKSHIDTDVLGLSVEDAKAWQDNTEREFQIWAENKRNCDALGLNDFYKIQQLAFYSSLLSGDCITLLQRDFDSVSAMNPYSLKLNLIEADRLSTPNTFSATIKSITDGINSKNGNRIFDGVEVDKVGKVVAYHISSKHKNEFTQDKQEWTRVEAYGEETGLPNVILTMADVERPSQYRGLPLLAPVIETLVQIRRYTDSELMAAVVESLFTAFIKTNSRSDENPLMEVATGEEPLPDLDETEYEMGSGNIVHLKPDEDVTFGDPKRPAGGFASFIEAVATQMGAALEISKEILMKQFNASYSASRAALLEFWKLVKMRREWFVSDWCRPVYEAFMYEAVALGRIKAPGFFNDPVLRQAWLGADFIGPSQGMLDPTKEITAEQMACENGFSSRADSAIKLNGSEFYKNIAALREENKALYESVPEELSNQEKVSDIVKANYIRQIGGNGSET